MKIEIYFYIINLLFYCYIVMSTKFMKKSTTQEPNSEEQNKIEAEQVEIKKKLDKEARAAKAEELKQQYNNIINEAINKLYIGKFSGLNSRDFQDKCGAALTSYILDAVISIKKNEVKKDEDDRYPASQYVMPGERKTTANKSKQGVNTKPKAKVQIKNKGVEEEEEEEEEESDEKVNRKVDEKVNGKVTESDEKLNNMTVRLVKKKKSNITTVGRSAKIWLAFIINRVIWEIHAMEGGKNIKNDGEFVNLVLKSNMTGKRKPSSQMVRCVIPTVERLGHQVSAARDYEFQSKIKARLQGDDEPFKGKELLLDYAVKYVTTYFKILGLYIANRIWADPCASINNRVLTSVVRMLDIGNEEYLASKSACDENDCGWGLCSGVYYEGVRFHNLLNQPDGQKKAKYLAKQVKKEVSAPTASELNGSSTNNTNKKSSNDDGKAKSTAKPVAKLTTKTPVNPKKDKIEDEEIEDEEIEDDEVEDEEAQPVKKNIRTT